MEQTYILANDRVKANCITAIAMLGEGWSVSIKKPGKTNPQRSYWHMAIGIIAEYTGYTKEQTKYMIKEAVLGLETWKDNRGKVHTMVKASETLTKEDYSRLIDYTILAANKIGCVIPSPLEYGLDR